MKKKIQGNPFNWPDFDWKTLVPNDFSLYFVGGLFKIKRINQPDFTWVKITGAQLPVLVCIINESNKTENIPIKEIEGFDFSFPPIGAYNFKNSVFFFSRKFSRQWKKGICKDSVEFEGILEKYTGSPRLFAPITKSFFLPHPFFRSPRDMACLFNSKYSSFKEAYEFLQKKKGVARAISKNIVLSLGANSPSPILWFSGIPVGTVQSDKPEIQLFYPEIAKEVKQLFPKSLLSYNFLEKEQNNGSSENEILDVEATTSSY